MISCHRVNQLKLEKGDNDEEYFKRDSYQIIKKDDSIKTNFENINLTYEENMIEYPNSEILSIFHWLNIKYFTLTLQEKKTLKTVQCVYIENKNTIFKNKIIIFNQGENTNISSIIPFLIDLSSFLKCNIITYEYIKQINKKLNINEEKDESVKSEKIVLAYINNLPNIREIDFICFSYGVYVNLITLKEINKNSIIKKINSIIIISPIWYKMIESNKRNFMNTILNSDMFQNYINIKIPNLIIHGKEDKYFKYMLSMALAKRLESVSEWYPNHGNHFNIIEKIKYKRKSMNKMKKIIYNSNISYGDETESITANFINVSKNNNMDDNINFENGSDSNDNSTNNISNEKNDNIVNYQNYEQSFCIKPNENNNNQNNNQTFYINKNENNNNQTFYINKNENNNNQNNDQTFYINKNENNNNQNNDQTFCINKNDNNNNQNNDQTFCIKQNENINDENDDQSFCMKQNNYNDYFDNCFSVNNKINNNLE